LVSAIDPGKSYPQLWRLCYRGFAGRLARKVWTLAMKIQALIVDDEQPARDELAFLLKSFPDVEVVGQGKNGPEALTLIRELSPQLVFLDVQMPGLDGFGVIKKLLEKRVPLPLFIFATAYDHYAVHAFEVNAIDYLLKPMARARLEKAIAKVRHMIEAAESTHEKLDKLVQMLGDRPAAQKTKLMVRNAGRLFLVDSENVIFASVVGGVVTLVTKELEGESIFHTIEDLYDNLDPNTFWRTHRSYIVNINRIKEVIPWFKGSYQLKMEDRKQTEIPVSRGQTKKLRELFKL
jgi:two-component system, LytTR family, response regulator